MKKLHRTADEKKLAGVCAGLGEYFDIDPVFFRLFFLASLFFGGLGALIYLLLWIMVPEKAGAGGGAPPRSGAPPVEDRAQDRGSVRRPRGVARRRPGLPARRVHTAGARRRAR